MSALESDENGKAIVWLSGGTEGSNYDVTCRIATTAGRVDDRTIRVSVRRR